MPRPKRNNTNQKQTLGRKDVSINSSTITEAGSKLIDKNHLALKMWKADVKDRMKHSLRQLNDMQKEKLAMFEYEFTKSLMAIPKNVLDIVIDINSEEFRATFLGIMDKNVEEGVQNRSLSPKPRTAVKRRSRSATNVKFSTHSRKVYRSTSVDMLKTPVGKVRLSTIMSNKKYTVSKPRKPENSGVHVKRIMKPEEEAISTCGSPLYVAPCTLAAPHVNIPLPGGVVLNIEPKMPKGPLEIPGLDDKTKNQIKILCEQLKKLF